MKKIAIIAGSFNPFHIGHLNIAQKAQRIHDETWIVFGKNPSKTNEQTFQIEGYDPVSKLLNLGFKITYLNGRTTPSFMDYHNKIHHNGEACYSLIRGLRSTTDLQLELTQYRYMQNMNPDINVVALFCDAEYAHVSSSGMKQLYQVDPKEVRKYLI